MKKWEYLTDEVSWHVLKDALKDRGSKGWELCSLIQEPLDVYILIFKREKQ